MPEDSTPPASGPDRRHADRRLVERRGRRAAAGAPIADRVLAAVCAEPWAITPDGLERVLAVVSRTELFPEALEARKGRPLADAREVTVRDGVATLPIQGTLTRYADFFSAWSGGTTYDGLATDLAAALKAPDVRALLLDVDSPGGEVNGCAELAALIADAATRIPVVAYIGGEGCSAAYWLAAAGAELVVASTALVGCLGVRMSMTDTRQRDAAKGVTKLEFVSSQTPDKALDPATDVGRSRVQRLVDDLAAVFLTDVAGYRADALGTRLGLAAAAFAPAALGTLAPDARATRLGQVAAQYGGGEVYVGQVAVDRGLADRVGTYEQVLAELAQGARAGTAAGASRPRLRAAAGSGSAPAGAGASSPLLQEPPMATQKTPAAGTAAGSTTTSTPTSTPEQDAATTTTEPPAGDSAATTTEPNDAGTASETAEQSAARYRTAGATAERTRILGILGHAKHASLATLEGFVKDASCSPADAAARILDLGAAAGASHLKQLAGDEAALGANGASRPGALGPGATGDAGTRGPSMAELFAAHNPRQIATRSRA